MECDLTCPSDLKAIIEINIHKKSLTQVGYGRLVY